ncbi:tyrosine-protein phosphatase [Bacillus sp. B15-48]|uniref:tyrosine-protein phosphatase n=1 Tax=Bacillus sp. B15-48 TaxID=1548601 RepID=UPI00193F7EF7|nr:protein-tyrosine-phosphatase [Bacillus sp. B15-48]
MAERITEKILPLQGGMNFRDMGGLETSDGRRVKQKILFRSGELSKLTIDDKRLLESFQIKSILDYRRQAEAERKPDPAIGQAVYERYSASVAENITNDRSGKTKDYYLQFTNERFLHSYAIMAIKNPAYKRLMEKVKTPEVHLPLIHHCSLGRDRTGVGAMIILMTLGVPFDKIVDDYLLSNQFLEPFYQKIFNKVAPHVSEEELNGFKHGFLLKPDYLTAAMNSILHHYGDIENYLIQEFGITSEIRKKIQDYCLE